MYSDARRSLAAILCTDITGFSALMATSEILALELLSFNRSLHEEIIKKYHGTHIKEIGDGNLVIFSSVINALQAGIEILNRAKSEHDCSLRVGLHQGELFHEGGDVFGDSVNLAFRIQEAALPDSMYFSDKVKSEISTKLEINFRALGHFNLKNIPYSIELFGYFSNELQDYSSEPDGSVSAPEWAQSIAVLPFLNLSPDPDQDFFSDGITEEIINTLATVKSIHVLGRTSSFAFKGKNQDLRQIGKELNVRTILEGSVRKAGSKIRISAQLIKTSDGYSLWSEKFDRNYDDIFSVQDEIALAVLDAVKINLLPRKKELYLKKITQNTQAYEFYLQGRKYYNEFNQNSWNLAIEFYSKAISIDSEFAAAYAGLSCCYQLLWFYGLAPIQKIVNLIRTNAEKAISLDPLLADGHIAMIRIDTHLDRNFEKADKTFKSIFSLQPNNAEAHFQYCIFLGLLGREKEANWHIQKALQLDPLSPMVNWNTGVTHWLTSNYEKLSSAGQQLINMHPDFFGGYVLKGMSLTRHGDYKETIPLYTIALEKTPSIFTIMILAFAYGRVGNREAALKLMDKIDPEHSCANYYLGCIHASLEQWDEMYRHYNLACDNHEGQILWFPRIVKEIPNFDYSDSRYKKLLIKTGYHPSANLSS